jgi:hypothetical protein
MDSTHPLVKDTLAKFAANPGLAESMLDHYIDHPNRLETLAEKIKAGDIPSAEAIIAERGGSKGFLMENEEALFHAFLVQFAPAAARP